MGLSSIPALFGAGHAGQSTPSPSPASPSSRNDLFNTSWTPSPPPPPLSRPETTPRCAPTPLPSQPASQAHPPQSQHPHHSPSTPAGEVGIRDPHDRWTLTDPGADSTHARSHSDWTYSSSPHPSHAAHTRPQSLYNIPSPSHATHPSLLSQAAHTPSNPLHTLAGVHLQGAPPVSPPHSPETEFEARAQGALLARRLAAAKSRTSLRDLEDMDIQERPPRTSSLSPASRSLSPSRLGPHPEIKYVSLANVVPASSRPPSPPSPPRPERSSTPLLSSSYPSPLEAETPPQPVAASSKTSSFFASAGADTPPPAPSQAPPSPLALSRAASLRRNGSLKRNGSPKRNGSLKQPSSPTHVPRGHTPSQSHSTAGSGSGGGLSPPNLSPLHQSPSLAPQWVPPAPTPDQDQVQLRLIPEPAYLLGEGRYASVYLAAYKKSILATSWELCAAKRLAPDRESQTMGLREGFFLNRLGQGRGRGKVHVVRLITVKDDSSHVGLGSPALASARSSPLLPTSPTPPTAAHPATTGSLGAPKRHRASTIYAGGRGADPEAPGGHAVGPGPAATLPPISRLVLVVEHAPLGTLDRLLRTSPSLVGPQLWGRWAREAAAALEWVHGKGVVHADVKPSNLLLTTDLHLRLSDFGSSLLIHPDHPPTDGVGLGTLPFSPPELVDPSAPFSFPVDIFALGATLYQCLTGREPYRGARPVEMMHYVRNGGLWSWAERDRLARVGSEAAFGLSGTRSAAASPYPSAWRADPIPGLQLGGAEVKRGGSLRVPGHHGHGHTQSLPSVEAPSTPLRRVGSAESILASADAGRSEEDSPAGVRLWAAWHHGRKNALDRLLSDEPVVPDSPVSRASSLRSPLRHVTGPDSRPAQAENNPSPTQEESREGEEEEGKEAEGKLAPAAPYADGSPPMFFLGPGVDGPARVPDAVRDLIQAMLEPAPEGRPTAEEVLDAWDEMGVGVGEEEVEVE